MKTFEFEIQELLSRIVEVEAKNEDNAFLKVNEMYKKEEIVLDSSDIASFNIKRVLTDDKEVEKDTLISEIVNYLYQDEKRHYEEYDENKPSDHIFLKLEKIKELI